MHMFGQTLPMPHLQLVTEIKCLGDYLVVLGLKQIQILGLKFCLKLDVESHTLTIWTSLWFDVRTHHTRKLNFGQTIWYKIEVLLGTSCGTT